MSTVWSRSLRYAIAVVSVAVTLGATLLLRPVTESTESAPFFAAVAIATRYGGLGPGLLSTLLSAWAVDFFFTPPIHVLTFDVDHFLHLGVFICVAAIISSLNASLDREKRRAEASATQAWHEMAERRKGEEERARLYAREQEANRLKDEFLATVSHELRTPLNSMLGWSRLLRSGALDQATATRALETIERNAEVQARLVGDILDVSRIITGKLHLDIQPLDLVTVVESALDAVRPAANAKQITLAPRFSAASCSMTGDQSRLHQVVWNLLLNAVKFTPPAGSVTVSLDCGRDDVALTVTDTGVGIPDEFLPFVFDRFRQADSSSARLHGGLGLGLAIVRHLVELHGGTVAAESAGAGRGATFTVRLPAAMATPAEQSSAAAVAAFPDNGTLLDGLRILVVDDDADARLLIAALLERKGVRVTTAASSADALARLDEGMPDLLIADIGMPGEDGYALIRRIRSRPVDRGGVLPAIAVTAYARPDDRRLALATGFQRHLAKPVEEQELVSAVASLAGRVPAT
jgi:signal transduction histidine kinase/ActR/RegA family two-component response regulator